MIIELAPNSIHPAVVNVYDDWLSWGHTLLGIGLGLSDPTMEIMGLTVFTGYQLSQSTEDWQSTAGDFMELGAGMLIASFIKRGR